MPLPQITGPGGDPRRAAAVEQDHLAFHGHDRRELLLQQPAPGARRQDEGVGVIRPEGVWAMAARPPLAFDPHHGLIGQQPPARLLEGGGQGRTERPVVHRCFLGPTTGRPRYRPSTRGAIVRTRPASSSPNPDCAACRSNRAKRGFIIGQEQRACARVANIAAPLG